MNIDIAQGKWTEIKGKIQAKWGKFSEDDLETLKGNLGELAGKIQKAYGFAKDYTEKEVADFRKSLEPTTTGEDKSKC
jgi:uncharacterized protein YjbJ (UPF0337 family)